MPAGLFKNAPSAEIEANFVGLLAVAKLTLGNPDLYDPIPTYIGEGSGIMPPDMQRTGNLELAHATQLT